jgi:hypothetical protein
MIDRCVKKKSHAVGHLEIKKYSWWASGSCLYSYLLRRLRCREIPFYLNKKWKSHLSQ